MIQVLKIYLSYFSDGRISIGSTWEVINMMGYYGPHTFGYTSGFGFGGWIIGAILFVLFVAALVAVIRWIFEKKAEDEDVEPISILKKRYVKGEITKREFENMKKDVA